jgi:hypothetical protein
MSADIAPPLAAKTNAAFKKVRGAIGGPDDDDLRELIVDRIVALTKDGVYDIEELSSRGAKQLQAEGLSPHLRPLRPNNTGRPLEPRCQITSPK